MEIIKFSTLINLKEFHTSGLYKTLNFKSTLTDIINFKCECVREVFKISSIDEDEDEG